MRRARGSARSNANRPVSKAPTACCRTYSGSSLTLTRLEIDDTATIWPAGADGMREQIWNGILEADRLGRYYGMVSDKYSRWHLILTCVVVVSASSSAASLLGSPAGRHRSRRFADSFSGRDLALSQGLLWKSCRRTLCSVNSTITLPRNGVDSGTATRLLKRFTHFAAPVTGLERATTFPSTRTFMPELKKIPMRLFRLSLRTVKDSKPRPNPQPAPPPPPPRPQPQPSKPKPSKR